MKIKLSYFYENGVNMIEAEYESEFDKDDPEFERCIALEVKKMRHRGQLPGLQAGRNEVHILIEFPENVAERRLVPLTVSGERSVTVLGGSSGNLINTGDIKGDFYAGDKKGKR